MAHFLGIPREVRDSIYDYVAHGTKLKHCWDLTTWGVGIERVPVPRATAASLFICCKQIYAEFKKSFYGQIQFDFSTLTINTGYTLRYSLDAALLRFIKVRQAVPGAIRLFKSMSNLQELQYYGSGLRFDILELASFRRDCPCTRPCGCSLKSKCDVLGILRMIVRKRGRALVGKCYCKSPDEDGEYGDFQVCYGEQPIRKIVTIWEYLDKPFKLVAIADVIESSSSPRYNEELLVVSETILSIKKIGEQSELTA